VKPLTHVLFALLLAALQAALLRWVGGGWFSITLVAACVVYLGLQGGNVDGSVAAAGVGYVLDLMVGTPKGLMTFLAVLLFVAVRAVSAAVDVRSQIAFGLLSGAGSLFLSLGAMVLTRITAAPDAAPGAVLLPRALLDAVLTGLLAPVVLALLRRLDALFHREEPGLLR
jgi:rod shape-determining protein MreD